MENLKSEHIDEREEGEISLDDVSSSEDTNYGNNGADVVRSGKKYVKREKRILTEDGDYGKENRLYTNKSIGPRSKSSSEKWQEMNDDLLPISSDEDIEHIGLPGTSKQVAIHLGPKKRRKKKKKKKSGPRMLVMDDLVSTFDDDPNVVGIVADDRSDFIVSLPYESANGKSPSPIQRTNSPLRHTGWHSPKSPSKHHYLPSNHSRSPNRRSPSPRHRSPRKFLSPRTQSFNPDRILLHKPSPDLSPGRYKDTYASSLLRRVRHLETIGSITPVYQQKYKESSLKDKLSRMMIKSAPEVKENIGDWRSIIGDEQNTSVKTDDDDDLEFLRRKALETKQLKNTIEPIQINSTNSAVPDVGRNIIVSDDDEEDLELRMIALRSAVMKKHYDRIQRGIMKNKSGGSIRSESPFGDSLLDSLKSDLDGVDHEDERNISPIAHLSIVGNALVEDMDLDSDIEREKENSELYSPIDESPNRTSIDQVFSNNRTSTEKISIIDIRQNSLNISGLESPNDITNHNQNHITNVSSPYSPSGPTCTSRIDELPKRELSQIPRDPRLRRHVGAITGMTESANSTAVFNPTLPISSPVIPLVNSTLNVNMNARSPNLSNLISVPLEKHLNIPTHTTPVSFNPISTQRMNSDATEESYVMKDINVKTMNVVEGTRTDITYNDIVRDLAEYTNELSHPQGVPDIIKDVNKIPTLVNRTLVPVPILKKNKQLQQPLLHQKSIENDDRDCNGARISPVTLQSQLIPGKKKVIKSATASNIISNLASNTEMVNKCGTQYLTVPRIPVVESCAVPHNPEITDQKRSDIAAANEIGMVARRSKIPRSETEVHKKTTKRSTMNVKSDKITTEMVNGKMTVKRNLKSREKSESAQKKETCREELENSTVDNRKNRDVTKSDSRRSRNLESTAHIENKPDEDSRNYLCATESHFSNSSTLRHKKDVSRKISKPRATKSLEMNLRKTCFKKPMTTKTENKKRRSSIDEDEEALRAALLASLSKHKKTSNLQSIATSSQSNVESTDSTNRKSHDAEEPSKQKPRSETSVISPLTTVPSRSVNSQKITNQSNITMNNINDKVVAKKRSANPVDYGPVKKIVKKSMIPLVGTAKILNVAEKIVDDEIQRKLALQRATIDLLCKKASQITDTNVPRPITKEPMTPKISASKSLERMIIRIGEDSDTDSDNINDDEPEVESSHVDASSKESSKHSTLPSPDFEKSVEEFLRSQREKQESSITMLTDPVIKSVIKLPQKPISPNTNTPLAVQHLPASKQEEYRRLKQRIAEREQEKMNRPIQPPTRSQPQTSSSNDLPSTASSSTTSVVTNNTIPYIEMNLPGKIGIQDTDKNPSCASNQQYTSISIQTEVTRTAMELLQPTMRKDDTGYNAISMPLLSDIPIKVDLSSSEATSDFIDGSLGTNVSITSNHLNEKISEPTTIAPMQLKDRLTIQFPNTRDDSYVRHVTINKGDDVLHKHGDLLHGTSLGLRILTTDQLNMKFECTHSDGNDDENHLDDRKLIFNESAHKNNDVLLSHDTMGKNVINSIDDDITIETCKIETNETAIEPSELSHQNTYKSHSTFLPHSMSGFADEKLKYDEVDTTTELDPTIMLDPTIFMSDIETTKAQVVEVPMSIATSPCDFQTDCKFDLSELEHAEEFPDQKGTDIQKQLESLDDFSEHQQQVQLTTLEKELVAKRYVVLHNLTQMAGDLQQWEVQIDFAAEVQRLRMELQLAEQRLQAQRTKTMAIRPQVILTQTLINQGQEECNKLSSLCQGVGSKVMGAAYKIPKTGDLLLKERLREVACMTKQLSKRKTAPPNVDEEKNHGLLSQITSYHSHTETIELDTQSTAHDAGIDQHSTSVKTETINSEDLLTNESCNSNTDTSMNNTRVTNSVFATIHHDLKSVEKCDGVNISAVDDNLFTTENGYSQLQPVISYESVLAVSNTPRHMDPNRVLCPFELMGTCSDEACPYNHFDANRS